MGRFRGNYPSNPRNFGLQGRDIGGKLRHAEQIERWRHQQPRRRPGQIIIGIIHFTTLTCRAAGLHTAQNVLIFAQIRPSRLALSVAL